ncbi:MAG: phosphate acyltransferase PlsX, partial [Deltaproteobacteria bacterium]|nr:phosphate acyltransferase PlsX [Deltaproteobacteria bacterium]
MTDRSLRIAVDAMGGDDASREPVRGAAEVSRQIDVQIALVGDPEAIKAELGEVEHNRSRIDIVPATQVVAQDEKPRPALDAKPDASILVASRLVAAREAHALVSAGSTGALVLASAREVPRIPGVKRAALAAVYPTQQRANNPDRFSLLLDVGATVRCRSTDLLFFAYMGHAYASRISKVARPTVALLNMGTEPTKGDDVLREAYRLMDDDALLNFIGNVEGNDIPGGRADVIVCEGFVGNVSLKMAEGVNEVFKGLGKWAFKHSLWWKAGLMLLSGGLRRLKDLTDYSE